MFINDIDEINMYPNSDGSFEIQINTTSKDKAGKLVNPVITLSHMHLSVEASGGIGNTPNIKMIFEGN